MPPFELFPRFSNQIVNVGSILFLTFMFCEVNNIQVIDKVTSVNIFPDDVFFEIVQPPELEYTYRIIPARDFGAPFNSSFWLKNTKLVPMEPIDGCSIPLNRYQIRGYVAFAERGECSFLHKTLIAEQVGARAIIITEGKNNSSWDVPPDDYIEMIADKSGEEAGIPAAFLLGSSGIQILTTLKKLHLSYAVINIPINMTFIPINKMNQPPWVSW